MDGQPSQKYSKYARGFTLIEFVAIIIIMGVLASIALPLMIKGTERARINEAKTILGSLRRAQLRYVVRFGLYASDLSLLDVDLPPAKYFTYGLLVASDITALDAAIATASRTSFQSVGLVSCRFNITAGGNFTANSTVCQQLI